MSTTTTGGMRRAQASGWRIPSGVAFATVLVLWLAFAAALVAMPGALDDLWRGIDGLWLPVKALVWLIFLPWALGLWAWQTEWALWARLGVVIGLAVATIAAFFPRRG